MPDIQQRIAEVLRGHQPWDTLVCDCGWDSDHGQNSWSSHVAEVLVSELGLTRRWAALTSGGSMLLGSTCVDKETAEGIIANNEQANPKVLGVFLGSRYVTEWVPE